MVEKEERPRAEDERARKGHQGEKAEEEEEDEEGDHGSIVAFRIPCRPSVDFRPLPLRSPLQLLQPDLCTPCSSPPPFVPSTAAPFPLSLTGALTPLSPLRHPATRTRPSTLDRRRVLAPSTCTRRYAGPDPPTRHQTLFSPRRLPFLPPSRFSSPSFASAHLVSLSISRVRHFRPLCHPLLLVLSASRRSPSRRITASVGEARAAQSRSVA